MNRRWFVTNGIFASTLYLGLLLPSDFFLYIGLAIAFATSCIGCLVLVPSYRIAAIPKDTRLSSNLHYAVDLTFDLIITATLVYFNFTILAVFYFFHIVGLSLLRQATIEARNNGNRQGV